MSRPTDDELERRGLHAAEIEMDRLLHQEESASRGEPDATQHYDTASPVHAGRLAAAIHTLRLMGGSVRRLLGKTSDLEAAAGRHSTRLAVVEASVVILLGALGIALFGVQLGLGIGVLVALYLWLVA